MKPSDVNPFKKSFLPFIDTFETSEAEWTACLLLTAMQRKGNKWQAVEPRDVGEALRAEAAEKTQLAKLANNPFLRFDFVGLVSLGAARWVDEPLESPLEFTEAGLAAMRPFVQDRGARDG